MNGSEISLNGRVCIITGATSGIGREVALGLARLNAEVVMLCRSRANGAKVQSEIISNSENSGVRLFVADLSDQAQIRRVGGDLLSELDQIHVLLHNAGLMKPRRELTVDGLETTFAVNHLAPFLLTHLLLERIKQSVPARIITVTSGMHGNGVVDFNNLQGERKYNRSAYENSKLMNIMFSYKLARELRGTGVTSNTVNPGFVATNLGRELPAPMRLMMKTAGMSIEDGSRSLIFAASNPTLENVTGKFIDSSSSIAETASQSYDEDLQKKLWDVSLKLADIETF